MAARKKPLGKQALIRIGVSFNGMRRGDETWTDLDATVQSWVNAGLVRILEVERGEDPAGPSGAEPAVPVDGTERGGGSGPSGGEQG